jgi:hypothetical protein
MTFLIRQRRRWVMDPLKRYSEGMAYVYLKPERRPTTESW